TAVTSERAQVLHASTGVPKERMGVVGVVSADGTDDLAAVDSVRHCVVAGYAQVLHAAVGVPEERLVRRTGLGRAHDLAGVVDIVSAAVGAAERPEVEDRAVLPQPGMTSQSARDLARIVDRAGAEAAEIDDVVAAWRAAVF